VSISLVTVAATALVGAVERWRYGQVEFPTGLLFAASGMLAAPLGGWLGTLVPEPLLLSGFAALMLLIAVRMWAKSADPTERSSPATLVAGSGPACRRDPEGKLRMTSRCASVLTATGLAVGLLSGLFGVGGQWRFEPGVLAAAEMLAGARAFTATMQRRRTVRQFSDRAVDRAIIDTCLTAAGTS
jgi:uncharacterized membrane protein YfcA